MEKFFEGMFISFLGKCVPVNGLKKNMIQWHKYW